jgi:hypothetical protein
MVAITMEAKSLLKKPKIVPQTARIKALVAVGEEVGITDSFPIIKRAGSK